MCLHCLGDMTAQRSTKLYCSEACKQRAKRVRERQDATIRAGVMPCEICGKETDTPTGKYCSDECRRKARRFRYRTRQFDPYRVVWDRKSRSYRVGGVEISELEGPRGINDPDREHGPWPCWHDESWHKMARLLMDKIHSGEWQVEVRSDSSDHPFGDPDSPFG